MNLPEGAKFNLLTSFPYVNKGVVNIVARMGDSCRWMIDSGAFTVWKSGGTVELDDYCKFLEALPIKPWCYFTLDVIGDAEATLRNYDTMLERGFKPIPIYTRGDNLKSLDYYYQTSNVVGFGGLSHSMGRQSRFGYVYNVLRANNGRAAHLLGFTDPELLKTLRPYSGDSSNWTYGARYGKAYVYLGYGKFTMFPKIRANKKIPENVMAAIYRLGFPAAQLGKLQNWHGGNSMADRISAASWVYASADIERNLGTKVFIACSTDGAVNTVATEYERMAA